MTREEAIEAIKCNWPDSRYTILREALDMAISAIRAQQEHSEALNGWISVDDRLPEDWADVLALSRFGFLETAVYTGVPGKWRTTWNGDMLEMDSITHWMPLPEQPCRRGGQV